MKATKQLPMDWNQVQFGDIATFKNGANFCASESGFELKILGVGDFQNKTALDNTELLKTVNLSSKPSDDNLVKIDDLVFVRSNGSKELVGRCLHIKCEPDSLIYSGFCIRARLHSDITSPDYINFLMQNGLLKKQLVKDGRGTNISNLNQGILNKLSFMLPPLPEQKAIANLLSTWDEAIEMAERLIQVKEKQLDAYGRKLFSRKNEMKYSGWEQVTLNDVLTEHGDKSTGQEEVYSVSVHKGLINQVEHLGRSFSAANTDHYNKVHYGDIVYTKSPTGDFPLGIVKQSHTKEDVIVSPLYGVFTPTCFSLGVVIDFYFSSPTRAKSYLFPIIQKGAKNTIAITNKTFLSKKLYLPLDEEAQKVVSEYITTSKKEIDLLKQLAEKYKEQKRGLMQKMLTGKWRVKDEIISKHREA